LLAIILFLLQSDSKDIVYPTTTCTIPFFNSFSQWNWQKVFEVTYTKNPPQQTHRQTTHKMIAFTAFAGIAGGGELSRRRRRRRWRRRSELAPHQLTLVDVFIDDAEKTLFHCESLLNHGGWLAMD
jgi:hypothetical protein